ncbi:type II toxin -antitoxin system TacA 1-like antitoxin [Thalassoglobus polymorphus]|uniref:Uncharacterized protein n=1 Tax=Thalassoglobus polymorphus TaxID=2527994 RepID=A0A517QL29_9PLAN|nr:hypothetical protein Mal48_15670 [Thalassoglobus polymorphus]
MAKKKPTRTGQQLNIRCSDEDADLFNQVAQIEGLTTAQQWMLQVCRKRARAILAAAESGNVKITETLIVTDE